MILRHATASLHVGRMAGWNNLWSPSDHDLAPPLSLFLLPFHPTSAPVRMLFFGRRKSSGICPSPTYIFLSKAHIYICLRPTYIFVQAPHTYLSKPHIYICPRPTHIFVQAPHVYLSKAHIYIFLRPTYIFF